MRQEIPLYPCRDGPRGRVRPRARRRRRCETTGDPPGRTRVGARRARQSTATPSKVAPRRRVGGRRPQPREGRPEIENKPTREKATERSWSRSWSRSSRGGEADSLGEADSSRVFEGASRARSLELDCYKSMRGSPSNLARRPLRRAPPVRVGRLVPRKPPRATRASDTRRAERRVAGPHPRRALRAKNAFARRPSFGRAITPPYRAYRTVSVDRLSCRRGAPSPPRWRSTACRRRWPRRRAPRACRGPRGGGR